MVEQMHELPSVPTAKRRRLSTIPTKEASIEHLPDALLVIIIECIKKNCSVNQFVSSIAAVNRRFRRLSMSGHLWSSDDFSSKDIVCWITKNVNPSLVCFDKPLHLKKLEHYSTMEIITIFDTLGTHVRSLVSHTSDSVFNSHQSLCRELMIKRCTSLVKLEIDEVLMPALVPSLSSLPKLVYLCVSNLCAIRANEGILQLVDALDSHCTGLTSLQVGSKTSVLFLEHPLNKIKQLRNLSIEESFHVEENFFTHLPPSLASLRLHSSKTEMDIPFTIQIAGNSSLESLYLNTPPAGPFVVEIEDCSRFKKFIIDGDCFDDFSPTFKSCPNLTQVQLGDFYSEEADSLCRVIDCPAITEFSASSALTSDIYGRLHGRLPSLTNLHIMYLDDSNSWLVTNLLRQLVAPNLLQVVTIHYHEFTEQVLEIALPLLRLFMIISPTKLPHTISLVCPKLKTLMISNGRSEETADKLKCLNLARCPNIQRIMLDDECVECVSVQWIVDIVRNSSGDARKQLLGSIRQVINNLEEEEQDVCWKAIRALEVVPNRTQLIFMPEHVQ
eukprot:CAMPEP_0184371418 /NCGR_PEP_ID=MMETSP1089-20130417/163386_1 /TAXON_ID=38269 ORGANISM="Gloeochaete wittrockiana, Strain SAG46.84" /NCGR_SAMPLE_ID=MMETSP1089 /ASSEMBLY_ACC=CAM_ASM_000445 /LENGTH=556 /DNA_ID=CAMNT_0026714167 /DNA_START=71 /DNA_END=1741 /DNA_ORIENTATION=-